jgi:hypothetical protein
MPGQPNPDYVAVNLREAVNIIKKFHRDSAMDSLQNDPEVTHTAKPAVPVQTSADRPSGLSQAVPLTPRPSAAAASAANPAPSPSPVAAQPLPPTQPQHQPQDPASHRTEQLLEGIQEQLRQMRGSSAPSEDVSIMRVLAGVAQMLALACLVLALWKLTSERVTYYPVFTALGFAAVLQTMALTFYSVNRR